MADASAAAPDPINDRNTNQDAVASKIQAKENGDQGTYRDKCLEDAEGLSHDPKVDTSGRATFDDNNAVIYEL